jgi:hypothetical protein
MLLTLLMLLVPGGTRQAQSPANPGSTYEAAPDGVKAAFRMLGRLGYPVERSTRRLGDGEMSRLLFMIAPERAVTEEHDVVELLSWIEDGGTLVYVPSPYSPNASRLHEDFGISVDYHPSLGYAPRRIALDPSLLPARTAAVNGRHVVRAAKGVEPLRPLALDGGALVERAIGAGRIIVVADATLFGNVGLREADNALLLATICQRYGGGGPILFDERTHGFTDLDSVLPFSKPIALAALCVAAIAFLLYAWAGAVRLGLPSPAPAPARAASTEQVAALGRFYERAGARAIALARLGDVDPPPSSDIELLRRARAALNASQWEKTWHSSKHNG